jgi:ribosomal protein S18 acetylase RimI-like enzyme
MSATVRALEPADLPAALALWVDTPGLELAEGDSPAELARYLARNPGCSSVAVVDGRLVAAVLAGHDGRRGLLYHLAVHPAHRGRGLGRAVVRRSLDALSAAGLTRALLLVAADNPGGRAFWLREGWDELEFARPFGRDL